VATFEVSLMGTNRVTVMANQVCRLAVVHMPFMGNRLREQRERKRFTQQDIAAALGIKVPSYSDYERGEREPNTERLIQLCKILSCSADYLLGFVDDPAQTLAISELRADEQKLLELYNDNKIPRVIKQLLGDPEFLQRDNDTTQIESGSQSSITSQEKTA
jgi:transcriptional regulator with XRE-family HTH domain